MILSNEFATLSAQEYLDLALGSNQAEYENVCVIFRDLHNLRAKNKSAYKNLVDTSSLPQLKRLHIANLLFKLVRFQLYASREILDLRGQESFGESFQNALRLMAAKFGTDHG